MNTLTRAAAMEPAAASDHTDGDDAVGVVIVTGNGRALCAGADLSDGGFGESADGTPERDRGDILALRTFTASSLSSRPLMAWWPE